MMGQFGQQIIKKVTMITFLSVFFRLSRETYSSFKLETGQLSLSPPLERSNNLCI